MSLNSAEIDLVLKELPLTGCFIQNIRQINYTQVVFDIYGKEGPVALLVSLRPNAMRIHATERKFPSMKAPPRFVKYLRAHIKGGKINDIGQIGRERIVYFDIVKGDIGYKLYVRFWGGAANMLIADEKQVILDAFSRRPARKEIPGEIFSPESSIREKSGKYSPREIPGDGLFNSYLDDFYGHMEKAEDLAKLREKAEKALNEKLFRLSNRLKILERKKEESGLSEQYKKYGDMIMANLHLLKKGDAWLTAEDYDAPGTEIRISLNPRLSPRENGEKYYTRFSGARKSLSLIEEEIEYTAARLKKTEEALSVIASADDPELLNSFIPKTGSIEKKGEKIPGLQFASRGFLLLVGRSADENDRLLRHYVRGNDLWLHVRDYSGGYVFIKTVKGKSVPLDVLLDAGNLAVHYSKARNNGGADLFYTSVKYLRRAKNGKKGTVLPTQEKNLSITLDKKRLEKLFETEPIDDSPSGQG